MPADDDLASTRDLRVLAHPLRLRLLSLLTARALSGSEAASLFELDPAAGPATEPATGPTPDGDEAGR